MLLVDTMGLIWNGDPTGLEDFGSASGGSVSIVMVRRFKNARRSVLSSTLEEIWFRAPAVEVEAIGLFFVASFSGVLDFCRLLQEGVESELSVRRLGGGEARRSRGRYPEEDEEGGESRLERGLRDRCLLLVDGGVLVREFRLLGGDLVRDWGRLL